MAKSKKKGRKLLVLTIIFLVIAGLGTAAFLRKREVVITVQTEKATRRNLTELVMANGRVQPVFYVKISPEVSGEIIELPVKEGQEVKKGDLLVRIKPDTYVAQSNSATASFRSSQAGLATAQANLARAEAEFHRQDALFQGSLVSESLFVDAKTSFQVAQAQLRSATHQVEMSKAALDRAEEDLRKTIIYSPLDGTVIRLNSQAGERVVGTAMMAGTEIMTIADLNEMEARVEVGEVDVPLMRIGQTARLEGDAFKDRKFSGTVTEIANSSRGLVLGASAGSFGGQSQEATKFEVKIRIKEKEAFRPGMTVTAEIETRYRSNVLTVPIASVTTRLPKTNNIVAQAGVTNAPGATNTSAGAPSGTNAASTNLVAGGSGNSATNSGGTNLTATGRKPGEAPKPIEVVFVRTNDVVRMVPIKRGVSDDSYMEITEGLEEGQEVVSGGFRAISRELEDGKKVKVGPPAFEKGKEAPVPK